MTSGHSHAVCACSMLDRSLAEIPEFAEPLVRALAMLLEGSLLAADVQQSPWDFAVEVEELRALGLSRNAVRWLVSKGYALHAVETTDPGGPTGRQFQPLAHVAFEATACLVLTEAGVQLARALRWPGPTETPAAPAVPGIGTHLPAARRPQWDAACADPAF